jgi:probable F420-dependent oxidoreductase
MPAPGQPLARPAALFIRLPHSWCGASPDAVLRVADLAEELGFAGISVQDHILSGPSVSPCGGVHTGDDRTVMESFTTLTYVAARTTRLRLLTGVIVLPYRHPIWVAKVSATLDVLSGGRLVLGVGVGAPVRRPTDGVQNLASHADIAERETALFALPGARGAIMDEALVALDRLWREDHATFHGRYIDFTDVDLYPKPLQEPRIPIWIGGRAEAAKRRAALLADAWFPSQASVEVLAAGRATVLEMAREAGLAGPRDFGVNLFVAVDPDGAAARELIRQGLGHRFRDEAGLFSSTIAGTPDEVRRRILDYVAAGVTAFDLKILPLTTPETLASMRYLAAEVMPALG